jgi:hypothetical protein
VRCEDCGHLEVFYRSCRNRHCPKCQGAAAREWLAKREAFTAEQPELQRLPEHRFDAVLKLERRVSHDGFVAIGGNYYSVPDRTRRVVEVQQLPDLIRILDLGIVVAEHPVLEGRKQYRIDRSHRTGGSARRTPNKATGITLGRIGDHVPLRSLAFYQAIGDQLAVGDRP